MMTLRTMMAMLVLMVRCRNGGGEDDNVEDDDGDAGLDGQM